MSIFDLLELSLRDLPAGMYPLLLRDAAGRLQASAKLLVGR
jgi:hypothetical protein